MHANQTTLENLYLAFSQLDADGMAACYADSARFEDEAFSLRGKHEVAGMWRMLCSATLAGNRADWRLTWRDVQADAQTDPALAAWIRAQIQTVRAGEGPESGAPGPAPPG